MCGRYVITKPLSKTKNLVKKAIKVEDFDNYNSHPTQFLPVIKKYVNGNTLENLRWGILPSWAKKREFKPFINARLETIKDKASFKNLFKFSRCIIIADGYYEWSLNGKIKVPYYLFRKDNKALYLAGIFQNNEFCIITQNASSNVSLIHHRQPVIINESDINNYLDLKTESSKLLKNYKFPELEFHKISKKVNNPINNNKFLIERT